MIIRKNKSTFKTVMVFLCILLLWTVFFIVWLDLKAEACEPNDPTCSCESDASAIAGSSSESSGIGVSISSNEIQVDTSSNPIITTSNKFSGANVEVIEGDTVVSQGDNIFTQGDTVLNPADLNTNISNDSIYDPGIILPDIPASELQIGDVKKTIPSVMPFIGVSNANYRHRTSIMGGVALHIPFPDKYSDKAFSVATEKIENERDYLATQNTYLIDENARLQARHNEEMKIMEREHQARFVELCTSVHKYALKRPDTDQFNKLYEFCYGIENENNDSTNQVISNIPPKGRHNQEVNGKPNPDQFSPHSEGYHTGEVPVMIDASMAGR